MSKTIQFQVPVSVSLSADQITEAKKFVNLALLGDENCNEMADDGCIVPKYPYNQVLIDAHFALHSGHTVYLTATVFENGTIDFTC